MILRYQRDPSGASDYIYISSSQQKECSAYCVEPSLLHFACCLLLLLPRAKCLEPSNSRVIALLCHYSPRRKERSLVRRERVSQEGEAEITRVLKKSFSDTLFLKKEQQLLVLRSFVFFSSYLEEDCSTEMSQMIFEHLSILCSVQQSPWIVHA